MKKVWILVFISVSMFFVNSIANTYTSKVVYFVLPPSFHSSDHIYVNSDQYGNVVILNDSYPCTLYVTNVKDMKNIQKIEFPFSEDTLISGIDIFKTNLIFFISSNNQSSKFFGVLYNYKKQKIQTILSFDDYVENPQFSWDGKEIAFVENINSEKNELIILQLSTGKEKVISDDVIGPIEIGSSEIGWNEKRDLCFAVKYDNQGITYSNMGIGIALQKNLTYNVEKFYPSASKTWKNVSFPYFISKSTVGFIDRNTFNLVMFNFLTNKVVMVKKLNVPQGNVVSVQYTNGKILVVTVGK